MEKRFATIEDLGKTIGLFQTSGIRFWLDGGWGVDVLAGCQTRPHRDIDINFDADEENALLTLLREHGYTIQTDSRPVRFELHSDELGCLDLHPFIIARDGSATQACPDGGHWSFDADFFCTVTFEGMGIPCMSVKAQKLFHTGYELRESDRHDLAILALIDPISSE